MGRPMGSKNKSKEGELQINKEANHEEERQETAKAVLMKQKLEPLGPGQRYFEAPDGTVLIGEDTQPHIWYRAGNEGKGMFINPKR